MYFVDALIVITCLLKMPVYIGSNHKILLGHLVDP